MEQRENIILEKTIAFSLKVIAYTEQLEGMRKYVIANQLLKCGTSIGANVHEAQNAESKGDFIHKFKIAAKEIEETKYWLTLCKRSEYYPDCTELQSYLNDISNIVTRSLQPARKVNWTKSKIICRV